MSAAHALAEAEAPAAADRANEPAARERLRIRRLAEDELLTEIRQAEQRRDELREAAERANAALAEAEAQLAQHDNDSNAEHVISKRNRRDVAEQRFQIARRRLSDLEAARYDPEAIAERLAKERAAEAERAAVDAVIARHDPSTPDAIAGLLKTWRDDLVSVGQRELQLTMARALAAALSRAGVSKFEMRDIFERVAWH